ncbi:tRNA pseudouridine synthase B [Desulfosarcina ovata subsp. sediminis]|uniref:tRNA pseudouridine synthase B n=1 Tax=Desulfosarcina ovata subsp. sediminis TaxID=885957 RepID=A0A5K7ZYI0_9BACT|nr:tRNA pseudouridine(55) synthase TruB [Desulfosarcina ovata]BBO85150.1 tRNA pseudouridine synthase B [Desulfosarcina ovata subsp. sediminis]
MPDKLSGLVVVDKPEGVTSAGVVARVKKIFGARKVGHTGTLDPFATGVLVCCLNRATRLSRFLLKGDKSYVAELLLGVETDTQDATGQVLCRRPLDHVTAQRVHAMARRFVGEIEQVPPIYSALKHQGTPLYKLARKGVAVEKPARPVRIDRLEILSVDLPVVRFAVSCSAGTYVRTLCADMGRALGCGGHLSWLRRTTSCGFTLDDAMGLEALEARRVQGRLEETVIPMDAALPRMPAMAADAVLARKIGHGMKLAGTDFPVPPPVENGAFKVVDPHGCLIAVLDATPPDSYNYCCVLSS